MTKPKEKITWGNGKRKVKDLKPFPGNPRKADEKQVQDIDVSLERFNLADPLVINTDNVVVGGNLRLSRLTEKGVAEADVRIPSRALTQEEANELNLRLNKNVGSWDFDVLANFSEGMLLDVGFESEELDKIFDLDLNGEDEIPEPPEKPKSKLGDIYQLGEHRLMCGDSTKKEDVEKLMDNKKADMVFTSPPYWVGFEYENEKDKESILQHIEKSAELMTLFSKKYVIINTGNINSITVAEKITGKKQPALLIDWWRDALNRNNFLLRHIRIWAKFGGIMPSRRNDKIDMHWEYIGLFADEETTAGFISTFRNPEINDGQNMGTPPWAVMGVWMGIHGKARGSGHVAAFPVELPKRYLIMYTKRGEIVLDSYGGSGSTLIACEQLNRKCFMMELDPKYIDVIIQRFEKFTGKQATKLI